MISLLISVNFSYNCKLNLKVKHYFEIKPYISFEKTQFYPIEELGKGVNETDEFFIRFKDDPDYQKDIEIISYSIQKIGKETGALERHFRPESKAKAIPIIKSKLRLYCYRISDELVILGNGGIKSFLWCPICSILN